MLNVTAARERDLFPILESSTYLVSHSMGAAPLGARDALDRYWNDWATDGPEAWERWLPEIGAVAGGIGEIIGAPPGSIKVGGETVKVGKLSVEKLVDLSKHDYRLEPNVTITPDNKWVVFRSNMHGPTHVYAVEVARSK